MPFTVGTTLALSPKESLDLIWGSAAHVYNFFSQTGLQPAAAVYMAECSITGGDSEGWRTSLKSFAQIRVGNGFEIGTLRLGYSGKHVLTTLLETPYGTRWLGVLAVSSLLPNEYEGSQLVRDFLTEAAPRAVQFLLGREQCEKLWNLGREIFSDSPFYYEFLRISSVCLQAAERSMIHEIFGTKTRREPTDISFLLAAYRLWELSGQRSSKRQKLYAKGALNFSQLIFYLTVVCGFHCSVSINDQELHFGDSQKQVEVQVKVDRNARREGWETGYYMEDMTVTETVSHMFGSVFSSNQIWRPGRAAHADCCSSMYHVDATMTDGDDALGEFLLTSCNYLKRDISDSRLASYVSRCLASSLHFRSYYWLVCAEGEEERGASIRERPARADGSCKTLARRLRRAVSLFAPGLIQPEHLDDLIRKVEDDEQPAQFLELKKMVPHGQGMCDCKSSHDFVQSQSCPRLANHQSEMNGIAWKIWICAQVDVNAHMLRNVAPDYLWRPTKLKLLGIESANRLLTRDVLAEIAGRLVGHEVYPSATTVIASSAGGHLIGISGNEAYQIEEDPGFSIYIFPGAIEHPERRIIEVFENEDDDDPASPDFAASSDDEEDNGQKFISTSRFINQLRKVQDTFGPGRVEQFIRLQANRALLSTNVVSRGKTIPFRLLRSIEQIRYVSLLHGCLGECAAGKLTGEETSKIRVVDASDPADIRFPPDRLTVIQAFQNTKVQRALISGFIAGVQSFMIQTGECVPCAIRAAKTERAVALFC